MADTTTFARILLRTKDSGYVSADHTLLYNTEIVFGGYEKCIYVKNYDNNVLFKYAPIDDSTNLSIYRTWSSSYIDTKINSSLLNIVDTTVVDTTSVWSRSFTKSYVDSKVLEINDSLVSSTTVWSSSKINLSIPDIVDSTTSLTTTTIWSRSYTNTVITNKISALPAINDTTVAVDSTSLWSRSYSKNYVDTKISALPVINDSATSTSSLWSSTKINSSIPAIVDTSAGSSSTIWSSSFTKTFINTSLSKSMIFTASSITPHPTTSVACTYPETDSDSVDVLKIRSIFEVGDKGFWNIVLPTDLTSNIKRITLVFSGPVGSCEWQLRSRILTDGNSLTTGGSWSTVTSITDSGASNVIQIKDQTGSFGDIFGTTNMNKFCILQLSLATGQAGQYKFYSIKLDY